jgi:hypothetical protein
MRARLSPSPAARSEEQALALVGLIYDTAGNSSLWPRFLREFGKALHAPATKRIFVKTGTKRQAELVGLVLRSPVQVRSYHPNG